MELIYLFSGIIIVGIVGIIYGCNEMYKNHKGSEWKR